MPQISGTNVAADYVLQFDRNGNPISFASSSDVAGVNGLVVLNPDGSAIFGSPAFGDNELAGAVTTRDAANLPQSTTGRLFTVSGGRVLILDIIGEVTTIIQAQATTYKILSTPTAGTAVDMCTTADLNALEVGGKIGLPGIVGSALSKQNAGLGTGMPSTAYIVGPGTIDALTVASSSGQLKHICRWLPIDAGAVVSPNGASGSVYLPTAAKMTQLRHALFGKNLVRATGNLPAAAGNVFIVSGGRVILKAIWGEVTTIIQAQATTFQYNATPPAGSAVVLGTTVDINALEVGGRVAVNAAPVSGATVKANAGAISLLTPADIILSSGTIITQVLGAASSGQIEHHAFWKPFDPTGLLTAA